MRETLRRLSELGVVDGGLIAPAPVEETTRALSAPELVGAAEPGPAEVSPAGFGAAEIAVGGRCRQRVRIQTPLTIAPAELDPAEISPAEADLVRAAR